MLQAHKLSKEDKEEMEKVRAYWNQHSEALKKKRQDALKKKQEETEKAQYSSTFIHGRHTCDGCLVTPIVGIRYHATNIPDYDLCQKCFPNYKGKDIVFAPEELGTYE